MNRIAQPDLADTTRSWRRVRFGVDGGDTSYWPEAAGAHPADHSADQAIAALRARMDRTARAAVLTGL